MAYRYRRGSWDASKHPRDAHGRFRPKFSHGARLSPTSVSYSAGFRVPVVPGRANLYVGALARVEHAGSSNILKKQTDRAVNAVARRLGDAEGRSAVAQVFKGNTVNVRGLNVSGPKHYIANPTFRVSSTPASRTAHSASVRTRRARPLRTNRSRTPNVSSAVHGHDRLYTPGIARPTRTAVAGGRPRKRRRSRRR